MSKKATKHLIMWHSGDSVKCVNTKTGKMHFWPVSMVFGKNTSSDTCGMRACVDESGIDTKCLKQDIAEYKRSKRKIFA